MNDLGFLPKSKENYSDTFQFHTHDSLKILNRYSINKICILSFVENRNNLDISKLTEEYPSFFNQASKFIKNIKICIPDDSVFSHNNLILLCVIFQNILEKNNFEINSLDLSKVNFSFFPKIVQEFKKVMNLVKKINVLHVNENFPPDIFDHEFILDTLNYTINYNSYEYEYLLAFFLIICKDSIRKLEIFLHNTTVPFIFTDNLKIIKEIELNIFDDDKIISTYESKFFIDFPYYLENLENLLIKFNPDNQIVIWDSPYQNITDCNDIFNTKNQIIRMSKIKSPNLKTFSFIWNEIIEYKWININANIKERFNRYIESGSLQNFLTYNDNLKEIRFKNVYMPSLSYKSLKDIREISLSFSLNKLFSINCPISSVFIDSLVDCENLSILHLNNCNTKMYDLTDFLNLILSRKKIKHFQVENFEFKDKFIKSLKFLKEKEIVENLNLLNKNIIDNFESIELDFNLDSNDMDKNKVLYYNNLGIILDLNKKIKTLIFKNFVCFDFEELLKCLKNVDNLKFTIAYYKQDLKLPSQKSFIFDLLWYLEKNKEIKLDLLEINLPNFELVIFRNLFDLTPRIKNVKCFNFFKHDNKIIDESLKELINAYDVLIL